MQRKASKHQQDLNNIMELLPTPVADHSRGIPSPTTDYQSLANVVTDLLPTPRATNSTEDRIYYRDPLKPQNLENALYLLPTPTVVDMGNNKTPPQWEEWKQAMKAKHRNGNGHGRSLEQELLGVATSQPSDDGKPS